MAKAEAVESRPTSTVYDPKMATYILRLDINDPDGQPIVWLTLYPDKPPKVETRYEWWAEQAANPKQNGSKPPSKTEAVGKTPTPSNPYPNQYRWHKMIRHLKNTLDESAFVEACKAIRAAKVIPDKSAFALLELAVWILGEKTDTSWEDFEDREHEIREKYYVQTEDVWTRQGEGPPEWVQLENDRQAAYDKHCYDTLLKHCPEAETAFTADEDKFHKDMDRVIKPILYGIPKAEGVREVRYGSLYLDMKKAGAMAFVILRKQGDEEYLYSYLNDEGGNLISRGEGHALLGKIFEKLLAGKSLHDWDEWRDILPREVIEAIRQSDGDGERSG